MRDVQVAIEVEVGSSLEMETTASCLKGGLRVHGDVRDGSHVARLGKASDIAG